MFESWSGYQNRKGAIGPFPVLEVRPTDENIRSTKRQDSRFGRAQRAPQGCRTGMCGINHGRGTKVFNQLQPEFSFFGLLFIPAHRRSTKFNNLYKSRIGKYRQSFQAASASLQASPVDACQALAQGRS